MLRFFFTHFMKNTVFRLTMTLNNLCALSVMPQSHQMGADLNLSLPWLSVAALKHWQPRPRKGRTNSVNNSLFLWLYCRFFKVIPTQQMLPRRCCLNQRWHALSGSVQLPGKQASRCALRCTGVRYQVSTAKTPADTHTPALSAANNVTLHLLIYSLILFYMHWLREILLCMKKGSFLRVPLRWWFNFPFLVATVLMFPLLVPAAETPCLCRAWGASYVWEYLSKARASYCIMEKWHMKGDYIFMLPDV